MISSSYLMLIVATLVIGMGAQWYVNHKLKTYSHVANSTGLTGAEAARQMLSYYGISNVQVFRGGPGQDYFDPRSNSVTLSPEAFDGRTITATATACHEVGHACQYAQDYTPMKIRGAIVPAVKFQRLTANLPLRYMTALTVPRKRFRCHRAGEPIIQRMLRPARAILNGSIRIML